MNQDQRSAPSASHSVYVAMIRRGGWREGGTNNRSQLCKSQLQLRDVLKKGKKERKEDRRENEVRSLIQFVDEGRIRKVMRGEKSKITWSTMQSNYTNRYRLSILIHTYIYTCIHIYTHHCAFISGPYRPIPVGNCPLLCVTSPLKTIHVPRNLASTSLPSSLLLPHLHMNPNWAWGMVVVVGRRCGGW